MYPNWDRPDYESQVLEMGEAIQRHPRQRVIPKVGLAEEWDGEA